MDSATAAIHVDGSSLSELNTVSQKAKQSPSLLHQKRGRGMVVGGLRYHYATARSGMIVDVLVDHAPLVPVGIIIRAASGELYCIIIT